KLSGSGVAAPVPAIPSSEFAQIAVLSVDPARGPRLASHRHSMGRDHVVAETNTFEQRAVGDAGRGKFQVTGDHVRNRIFALEILDAGGFCPLALFLVGMPKMTLHLPANAAERGCCEDALRCAADTHIDVDAGILRLRGVDDARNGTVADQANGGAGFASRFDQPAMARPVEDAGGDLADFHAFGFGKSL